MKKALVLLIILTALLSLTGCGSNAAPAAPATPTAPAEPAVNSAAPEPTQTANPVTEPSPTIIPTQTAAQKTDPEPTEAVPAPETVDVDLTQLSSTMIYSEVYAMMYEPDQYDGKTVKMKGLFATQEYNGKRLYACIVKDATACCAQGLEFELAESRVFPDEFPEPGSEITVIGTFDCYTEEGGDGNYYVYLLLRNAKLL